MAHGFRSGLTTLHWTCNETNAPSIRIAEKLGFERQADYTLCYVHRDAVLHLAAQGYGRLQAGDAAGARVYLEQALSGGEGLPPFVAYDAARACALCGDADEALAHLSTAVNSGWREASETAACADFADLMGRAEWADLISGCRSDGVRPLSIGCAGWRAVVRQLSRKCRFAPDHP